MSDMPGMPGMSSSSSSVMAGMSSPTTAATAMASTSAAASMSGMDGMGNGCKISMLWNWYTINSRFISSQWKITSSGMFAGSCIGVILLVMSLEFLRRLGRAYDRHIFTQQRRRAATGATTTGNPRFQLPFALSRKPSADSASQSQDSTAKGDATVTGAAEAVADAAAPRMFRPRRPEPLQQVVRAFIHMLQFAVAYFIMLLAMYYNGYIIICIFIGAFLGFGIFAWEVPHGGDVEEAHRESTMCCG